MAVNYITVDRARQQGAELLKVVEAFRTAQATLTTLRDLMNNMTDDATFGNIETQFGVPAGKGGTLKGLVAGTVTELKNDVNFTNLMDWVDPVV
jgi:hypothetical protein